jgi:hypothetical protein
MSTVKSILTKTQNFSPVERHRFALALLETLRTPIGAPKATPTVVSTAAPVVPTAPTVAYLLWEDDDLSFERIQEFKKKNGITSSVWCYDPIGENDFGKPHGYKCKWISDGYRRAALKGNTWLDVWKCADKMIKKQVTDHIYIEGFWVEGDTLCYNCGS